MLTCVLGVSGCASSDPLDATVHSFEPLDETHIRIGVRFDNNSERRARVECAITLTDSDGVLDRDEIRSRMPIGSGGAEASSADIRIELAPEEVTKIEVDHCTATE